MRLELSNNNLEGRDEPARWSYDGKCAVLMRSKRTTVVLVSWPQRLPRSRILRVPSKFSLPRSITTHYKWARTEVWLSREKRFFLVVLPEGNTERAFSLAGNKLAGGSARRRHWLLLLSLERHEPNTCCFGVLDPKGASVLLSFHVQRQVFAICSTRTSYVTTFWEKSSLWSSTTTLVLFTFPYSVQCSHN